MFKKWMGGLVLLIIGIALGFAGYRFFEKPKCHSFKKAVAKEASNKPSHISVRKSAVHNVSSSSVKKIRYYYFTNWWKKIGRPWTRIRVEVDEDRLVLSAEHFPPDTGNIYELIMTRDGLEGEEHLLGNFICRWTDMGHLTCRDPDGDFEAYVIYQFGNDVRFRMEFYYISEKTSRPELSYAIFSDGINIVEQKYGYKSDVDTQKYKIGKIYRVIF